MRSHEIEHWALNIIDRVKAGQPIEDDRVELKGEWPQDHKKAARILAAQANAARGQPFLWLIGVDEKTGEVKGASKTEFSNWYTKVTASFNELAPEPTIINIPVDGTTVTAIYFAPDQPPYVVNNPEGKIPHREVPWRIGNRTETANRSQLLRILSPAVKVPNLEIATARLSVSSSSSPNTYSLQAFLQVFLTQPADQQTVIPYHRCRVEFIAPGHTIAEPRAKISFAGHRPIKGPPGLDSISLVGPDFFEVYASIHSKMPESVNRKVLSNPAEVKLLILPPNLDREISVAITLQASPGTGPYGGWEFENTEENLRQGDE